MTFAVKDRSSILIDGAMATELEKRGCDLKHSLWSAKVIAEAPHLIAEVHSAYFQAGSHVITAATYQGSIPGFVKAGFSEEQAREIISKACYLANEAREKWQTARREELGVAASLSSYGAFKADGSEYRGQFNLTRDGLKDFHRPTVEHLAGLAGQGVIDFLAIETIPSLTEAQALLDLLVEFPQVKAWVSFSLKDGESIADGSSVQKVAQVFSNEILNRGQIVAVGANCAAPSLVVSFMQKLGALKVTHPNLPALIAYPNSGETYDAREKIWKGTSAPLDRSNIEVLARSFVNAGVTWLGGCCRVGPEQIRWLGDFLLFAR